MSAAPLSLTDRYALAVAEGTLVPDAAQEQALAALQKMIATRATAKPKRLWRRAKKQRGLYLYGPVGRGKTMLMDWAFIDMKERGIRVERWHFHAFMLQTHQELCGYGAHSGALTRALEKMAEVWAARIDVLCFDEFHVTDVADAMIMMPLFTHLFQCGVQVIATSNWKPEELYSGGLQRQRFLPFIDTLKANMEVLALEGAQDHRQSKQNSLHGWLQPLNDDTHEILTDAFRQAVGYDGIETQELHVGNRSWTIPRASKHTAFLDIGRLLDQPLGAADFLALAKRWRLLFLDNLTSFAPDQNERAKRFMVLVDNLYDNGVKLMVRADAPLTDLYPLSGSLAFEFERTASRLQEMVRSVTNGEALAV